MSVNYLENYSTVLVLALRGVLDVRTVVVLRRVKRRKNVVKNTRKRVKIVKNARK
tara:strand:+ start:512 stop:676 length:165 start_codon:yes stop_codon:yes gene_type:complete